jgi:GNAT superfamily N-acetyltransferase
MPTVTGMAWNHVRAQVLARWKSADPLLPDPSAPPGCGTSFVAGPQRRPTAIGTCQHWTGRPGSLDLTWGASRRFRLSALTAGPDTAGSLDALLSQWRDHLAGIPAAGREDTAAIVSWPGRDIDGVATLLNHGLTPLTVLAARPASRRGDRGAAEGTAADGAPGESGETEDAAPAGVRIRRAGPADAVAVAGLSLEIVRFDAHFGCVVERPGTDGALRRYASALLSQPRPWAWLAERDGTPIGMVTAERPAEAAWISHMAGPAPAAYLGQMFVTPRERGRGVARALVARLHEEIDAAGVAVTLLHYEQVNPLSGPFWSRNGYRPLWISWEARPALGLR